MIESDALQRGRPRVPNVLTIAGSDPSGGAGIQADLKTFSAMGVYGCAVPAMLTAQNTRSVAAVLALPADFVRLEIDAVLADISIDAIKIGALGTSGVVEAVVDALMSDMHPRCANVVVDPVLGASNGGELLDAQGSSSLRNRLLPLATLATPNAIEAGILLGSPPPTTVSEMAAAAKSLIGLGPTWILLTGGHVDTGNECVDVLTDGSVLYELCAPRVVGRTTHGTGCTLSAAIASFLAFGADVPDACLNAQQYVGAAIAAAEELSVGGGRTPLHHIPLARAAAALMPADMS